MVHCSLTMFDSYFLNAFVEQNYKETSSLLILAREIVKMCVVFSMALLRMTLLALNNVPA